MLTKLELLALKRELGAKRIFVRPYASDQRCAVLFIELPTICVGLRPNAAETMSDILDRVRLCQKLNIHSVGINTKGWEEI